LYSTPVQRPALTSTRRATLSVSTVRFGRCRAGEGRIGAALWPRPAEVLISAPQHPSSTAVLIAAASGYPPRPARASPPPDTGRGDRAGATLSGPSNPRTAGSLPSVASLRRK